MLAVGPTGAGRSLFPASATHVIAHSTQPEGGGRPATGARTVRRLFAVAAACAAATAALGLVLERSRFGSSDAEALARVERSVRAQIDAHAAALRHTAEALAGESALLASASTDPTAARNLLDRADQIVQGHQDAALSVTVYGSAGTPVAWSGHPSELPPDRTDGPEALFVAPGPLGLRLVYVRPVLDGSRGRRLGSVAAERVLSSARGLRTTAADTILLGRTIVPVSLRARDDAAGGGHSPYRFVVEAPSGEPLLEAEIAPDALPAARGQWRDRVMRAVLAIAALAVLLWIIPLLEWQTAARSRRRYLGAVAAIVSVLAAVLALLRLAVSPDPNPVAALAHLSGGFLPFTVGRPAEFVLGALWRARSWCSPRTGSNSGAL